MKFYTPQRGLLFLFAALAITAIIINCRKIDYSQEKKPSIDLTSKFFNVPANAHSAVKKVAEEIKKQNKQHEFIKKFSKEIGLPIWGKSPVYYITGNQRGNGGGGSDTLVFLPLENPSFGVSPPRISSFLAAAVGTNDSVKIRLFRGDRYEGYGISFNLDTLTSELVAMQCMYLENYAYPDRDTFRII